MWATESRQPKADNDLYRLAAVTALLLALFLFAGASGHLVAIWPKLGVGTASGEGGGWLLLLPGLVLAATCVANALLAIGLWMRLHHARNFSLLANLACVAYLTFLFTKGVPGHPIGIFLLLVSCQCLLLIAPALGLAWPATGTDANPPHRE